jgi:hypothetical protein
MMNASHDREQDNRMLIADYLIPAFPDYAVSLYDDRDKVPGLILLEGLMNNKPCAVHLTIERKFLDDTPEEEIFGRLDRCGLLEKIRSALRPGRVSLTLDARGVREPPQ